MLQDALNKGVITEKEYNIEIKKLAVELAKGKLVLVEVSLLELQKVQFKDKETQKKALTDATAEVEKLKGAVVTAQGDLAKNTANVVEDKTESVAERMSHIFGKSFSDIGNMFTAFTTNLDKLKNKDLKSWDQWGVAIGDVVSTSLAVATQLNDQYYQYKATELEADKQRELTNAGDNAVARDAINQKYAQKELDLKKKQSGADTVLKIAQTIAAGAMAVMQAFAQLGTIGGAIATAFIGTTTALQIATLIQQNAAIQATTLDTSSTPTESITTGARVPNSTPQAAEGRYDVIGEQDKKTYRNVRYAGVARTGLVHTPTLYGEAGTELVIDAPSLRRMNMKAPNFTNFVLSNRVKQRADGNYTPLTDSNQPTQSTDTAPLVAANMAVMMEVKSLLQYLAENRIEAYTLLSEFETKRDLRDRSLAKGSLK